MPKRRVKRHSVTQPCDASYRIIPLTKGQNVIVDAEDFEWLSQWDWYAQVGGPTGGFYAARKPTSGMVYMHHTILKCGPGEQVDHRNHDTLDNRKANLRKCTHAENDRNKPPQKSNSSGFVGVHKKRDLKFKKWIAGIEVNGRHIHLGYFYTAEEAARARDAAAKIHHGEFAYLNFPSTT